MEVAGSSPVDPANLSLVIDTLSSRQCWSETICFFIKEISIIRLGRPDDRRGRSRQKKTLDLSSVFLLGE